MMQTFEAIIDERGRIHFLESVDLKETRCVLVTLLPIAKTDETLAGSLVNSGEILDEDLETASRDISSSFRDSLRRRARYYS